MSFVSPAYDVERRDRQYLRKAIKEAAKNRKPEPDKLKTLYLHTYDRVTRILEKDGEPHIEDIVRTALTAIEQGRAVGDVEALTTAITVEDVLDELNLSVKWDSTKLLVELVSCLPEEARTWAMCLLKRYESLLDVYVDESVVQGSLTKEMAAPEVKQTQIPVEVTVVTDLSEFTCKVCNEILDLLIHNSCKIPPIKAMLTAVKPGSTAVLFQVDKDFTENIIEHSVKASSLWAFQELSVTSVRIGRIELNVVQLLTQHFKEALRSGLTSGMDFVRATKVCVWYSGELVILLLGTS